MYVVITNVFTGPGTALIARVCLPVYFWTITFSINQSINLAFIRLWQPKSWISTK